MYTTPYDPSFAALVARNDPIECQTERAPDYYGLGVRLGVYFAWFQSYIANTMLPSEIAGAMDTNTIFLLTITIAMIKCSSIQMLAQIDGLILMHLSGGTIFGILSLWGYRTRQYLESGPRGIRFFGGFGTHSRLIVSLAVSIYGLWFWMYAVTGSLFAMGGPGDETDDPPNSPACGTLYTFMFARVRADGGIRYFYIIICILCTLYFGIMLMASTLTCWAKVTKVLELTRGKRWADPSKLRYATGFKYRELEIIFKVLRVLNLIWIIFSIVLVETTLNFNHVTAVLGGPHDNELHLPAQLLPLIIGAFGFVRTVYLALQERRSPGNLDPSLAESPTSHQAKPMRFGPTILQAFSPAMARDSVHTEHDPNEIDALEKRRSTGLRYLVAWLPWLSLLKTFRNERDGQSERTKRFSEGSLADEKARADQREHLTRRQREEQEEEERMGGVHHGMTV